MVCIYIYNVSIDSIYIYIYTHIDTNTHTYIHSIPFHSIPFQIPFHSIPFHSTPFHTYKQRTSETCPQVFSMIPADLLAPTRHILAETSCQLLSGWTPLDTVCVDMIYGHIWEWYTIIISHISVDNGRTCNFNESSTIHLHFYIDDLFYSIQIGRNIAMQTSIDRWCRRKHQIWGFLSWQRAVCGALTAILHLFFSEPRFPSKKDRNKWFIVIRSVLLHMRITVICNLGFIWMLHYFTIPCPVVGCDGQTFHLGYCQGQPL